MENIKNMTPKRKIILCFVSYYLPGFRSGGPVRTIANFVDHLGDEFDIRIVTRDHDALVAEPYPDVVIDEWGGVWWWNESIYDFPTCTSVNGLILFSFKDKCKKTVNIFINNF